MKRALFPGSFDPITLGHVNIVERACTFFDEIVVGIGQNTNKAPLFALADRMAWIEESFAHLRNVRVVVYEGLTVEACKQQGANFIVRGLRGSPDFEYEKSIAQLNYRLSTIETVFLITEPALAPVSSTIVRDIIRFGGDVSGLVPQAVVRHLQSRPTASAKPSA